MATSKLFKKVPIQVPNRSGFNMSHNNFFSAPVGTLVPNFIDFLIPGDEIDLSSKNHVQLPPMATDFYGRVEAKEEAFFVPARILFGGWKDFYVNPVDGITNPSNVDGQLAKYLIGATIPRTSAIFREHSQSGYVFVSGQNSVNNELFNNFGTAAAAAAQRNQLGFFTTSGDNSIIGAGSLLDYLGFKTSEAGFDVSAYTDYWTVMQILSESLLGTKPSTWTYTFISLNSDTLYISLFPDQVSDSDSGYRAAADLSTLSDFGESINGYLKLTRVPNGDTYNMIFQFVYTGAAGGITSINIPNILPLMAYHKIYDDWYRAPQIQQSLFKRNVANQSTATSVANMPWITSGAESKIYFSGDQLKFANGHSLLELHQRNWQKDYFTSATPEPQAGEASSVKFDIENESGEFTIASLRAANALQQWLDRNNIGGFRYGDMIYAQYGVYPSDAITDRAIYLGSSSTEVYNKSIYQQSGDGGTDTNNPFNAIGSKYSNPTGIGQGNFCNNYKVTEAGFVIKIFSLVPQAYYSTGVRRFFMHNDISDIAFPVLAGVGDQPIYGYELTDTYSGDGDKTVFGYVQRYADYKFIDDQVHGLLRDGESLDSFALQRSFSSVPQLGSDFLEIPRDYLDQVSATSYKLSQYGCWVNCYNDYRKSSTLPAYSIPTLEDMKGHTVMVDKGGTYLA